MRKGGVFPVLTCFTLVFCDCASAWFTAVTQESPVIVAVGDGAIFTCHTSKTYELNEVRWIQIQNGRHYLINVFHDDTNQQRCDLPEYVGRTKLMKEDLAQKRAALKLFNLLVADEGAYLCYLQTVDYFDFDDLNLTVTGGLFRKCTGSVQTSLLLVLFAFSLSCFLATVVLHGILYTCLKNERDGLFGKSTDVATILFFLALVCSLAAVVIICILYTCQENERAGDLDKTQSVTIKKANPKEEGPIGCESSPVKQALMPRGPDSEGASSAANTEKLHPNLPLEEGSSAMYTASY